MFLETLSKINCIILIQTFYSVSAFKNYDRHKVYQVRPTTISQVDYLSQLLLTLVGIDALTFTRQLNKSSNILVEPDEQLNFESLLQSQGIPYLVAVNNVTSHLYKNGIQSTNQNRVAGKIGFDRYLRMSDINEYLESLARKYPKYGSRFPKIEVKERGKSFEGRAIKTILLSSNMRRDKHIIFIDAGVHAREWMAPASALYVIHMLVEQYRQWHYLFETFDFLILPVVNPDGYEYSHTDDRLWRKTRSIQSKGCYGVDGNRNYDFHWSKWSSSKNPCAETYHGPRAFSEPEIRIVRDIMLGLSEKVSLYVSLHAFGSYLLTPWGYTARVLPENWDDIESVAKATVDELKRVHNKVYKYGPTSLMMYKASGVSNDYALAIAKIPIPIGLEVQDDGYGFDPPPSQISSIAQESWTCVKAMTEYLDNRRRRSLQQKNSKGRLISTSLFSTLPLVEIICSELLV